jgi:hypothetical protein
MQHRADSRKAYFLFNWMSLNAERARYPCSLKDTWLSASRNSEWRRHGLCKLVVLVETSLPCLLLRFAHHGGKRGSFFQRESCRKQKVIFDFDLPNRPDRSLFRIWLKTLPKLNAEPTTLQQLVRSSLRLYSKPGNVSSHSQYLVENRKLLCCCWHSGRCVWR